MPPVRTVGNRLYLGVFFAFLLVGLSEDALPPEMALFTSLFENSVTEAQQIVIMVRSCNRE